MSLRSSRHGGRNKYKYKPRSADDIKRRAEQQGGRYDSPIKPAFDTWRPKDGENAIRILPPTWEGADHYGLEIWLHKYVGADNSNYLCPKKMKGKECPICDAAKEAKDAGETDDARQLTATKNYACWVVDRDDDDAQPQIFIFSWLMDRDIAALCHMKRTGKVLLLDHPDLGYDLLIKRTGKSTRTRYLPSVERDKSPINEDRKEQDRIMGYIQENPLPTTLKYYPTEYLEKVLSGTTAKDKDDDEDEGRGSKRGKKRSSRDEAPSDEPASDEPTSDESASDEPASDEPKSRRGKGKSSRNKEPASDEPVSDEPASDEPASDEPASDAPKSRKKRRSSREAPSDEPASDEPKSDEPASDEPASDEPASDEPASDKPARKRRGSHGKEKTKGKGKEAPSDEPASDEPASDEAKSDEPASDEPASDEPASDEPASDKPKSRRGAGRAKTRRHRR